MLKQWNGLDRVVSGLFWCGRGKRVGMTALSLAGRLWMGCLGRTNMGLEKEESQVSLGSFPR